MALIYLSFGPRYTRIVAGPAVSPAVHTGCRPTARSRRASKVQMSRPVFRGLVIAWAGAHGLLLALALAIRWLA
jgi:hypothetical protein